MGDSYLAQQAFGCKPDAFCLRVCIAKRSLIAAPPGLAVSERPPPPELLRFHVMFQFLSQWKRKPDILY